MKQNELNKRNSDIALMLGWKNSFAYKVDQYGYYQTVDGYSTPYKNTLDEQAVEYQSDKNAFAVEDLQFHSDWNWLMESLQYITKIGWNWELIDFNGTVHEERCFSCSIFNLDLGKPFNKIKHNTTNPIEAVFIAVSDFAKLYNENKI